MVAIVSSSVSPGLPIIKVIAGNQLFSLRTRKPSSTTLGQSSTENGTPLLDMICLAIRTEPVSSPINGASAVLPQLRSRGRVSRGYMGVGLRDVDADLERSLKLTVDHGALVQDITAGSPADRAGLRPYDVITSLDDRPIANDDQLIREISARAPGSAARLKLVRDGHDQTLTVKLAERPARDRQDRTEPAYDVSWLRSQETAAGGASRPPRVADASPGALSSNSTV